jgi:hypothetical protein
LAVSIECKLKFVEGRIVGLEWLFDSGDESGRVRVNATRVGYFRGEEW